MNRNIVFCISLTFCLSLQALTDGPWTFTVANGEATLTGYSGTGPEDFVLPSSVESDGVSYPVTAVGSSAFSGKNWIKSILVPASVTNIADNVFHSCSGITNAVILAQADVIDLGMFPTQSTNFQTLVISGNGNTRLVHSYNGYSQRPRHVRVSGVRELGSYCFYNYPNLEDIVFEDDVLEIIGDYAFNGCRFDEVPCFGEGSKVKLIRGNAFNGCQNLGSVVIPNSVTNIGSGAFYNCYSLSNVTIGANIDSISGEIFSGQTNWVSLAIVGNGNARVSGFREKTVQNVSLSGVRELASSSFESCKSLRTLELVDDGKLKSIVDWSFYNCTNLTAVVVPSSVTNINYHGRGVDRRRCLQQLQVP